VIGQHSHLVICYLCHNSSKRNRIFCVMSPVKSYALPVYGLLCVPVSCLVLRLSCLLVLYYSCLAETSLAYCLVLACVVFCVIWSFDCVVIGLPCLGIVLSFDCLVFSCLVFWSVWPCLVLSCFVLSCQGSKRQSLFWSWS
jgi:hypothetical protein